MRTASQGPADDTLSLGQLRAIDAACERFEAAWVAAGPGGPGSAMEVYLAEVDGPARSALLRELIGIDVHYRRAHGTAPSAEDYLARFPGLDPAWLDRALAAPARPSPSRVEPHRA